MKMYENLQQKSLDEVLEQIRAYCDFKAGGGQEDSIQKLNEIFVQYMKNDEEYKESCAKRLVLEGEEIVCTYEGKGYYFIMTFLLHAAKSKDIYKEIIRHCIHDNTITKENKYYIYWRLVRIAFLSTELGDEETSNLMSDLYNHIYEAFKEAVAKEYQFIKKEERNKNFVIVFTSQFIGIGHGPTKTALDRCYILEQYLNKKVYLINTAEYLTSNQPIFCFNDTVAGYVKEYDNFEFISYKDKYFSYLQYPFGTMPDVTAIQGILDVIKNSKPYFILNIGGNSIVSDICSNLIPAINLNTVPSGRANTNAQFQVIGRKINEGDRMWLDKNNLPQDHIIESLFTSAFKEQTHTFTREELGLPQDKFICVLVGGRLDAEIDKGCEDMLCRLAQNGICIALMGTFNRYDSMCSKNKAIKENSVNLGFVDDVLAAYECCDLYINPKRIGGGTSAAEVLYKGLPAVALDYGDVGVAVGEDFHVADYEDMYNTILRYATDKEYYEKMSKKARERGKRLTDSKTEFIKVIQKMEESDRF